MKVHPNPHPECARQAGGCGDQLRRADVFTQEDRALLTGIITNYINE